MNYCLNCGNELKRKNKKFCDNFCQNEYQYKNYIQKWKDGKENGIRGKYQTSSYIRKYLLKKYNYQCARCGWGEINPFTNSLPLEIEHIDGDFSNNSENNLTILCPNCHSLTATYKGANKGSGRKKRKQYSL